MSCPHCTPHSCQACPSDSRGRQHPAGWHSRRLYIKSGQAAQNARCHKCWCCHCSCTLLRAMQSRTALQQVLVLGCEQRLHHCRCSTCHKQMGCSSRQALLLQAWNAPLQGGAYQQGPLLWHCHCTSHRRLGGRLCSTGHQSLAWKHLGSSCPACSMSRHMSCFVNMGNTQPAPQHGNAAQKLTCQQSQSSTFHCCPAAQNSQMAHHIMCPATQPGTCTAMSDGK